MSLIVKQVVISQVNSVKTTEWIHRTEDLSLIHDVLNSKQRDAPDDLCQLSTLTEQNLLSSLSTRFEKDMIYTYVNSILIAVCDFSGAFLFRSFELFLEKIIKLSSSGYWNIYL